MSIFLDRRCKYCNELLHKSTHVSRNERKKRDDAKEFCGSSCRNKYSPIVNKDAFDFFLYGIRLNQGTE